MILLKYNPEYVIPQLKTSQRISISHSEIQNVFRIYKDLSHLPPCHPFHLISLHSRLCLLCCSHTGDISVFPKMYKTSSCTRHFTWCAFCLNALSMDIPWFTFFSLPSVPSVFAQTSSYEKGLPWPSKLNSTPTEVFSFPL